MSELLLAGVGLIVIVGTWKYVWLPSVLDATRDTLFDLRDRRLRRYFISQGLGLDHPVYAALRNLLNGHLRNTRSLSLSQYAYMKGQLENDKPASEKRFAEINRKFEVDEPELQKFIDRVRADSATAMLTYMVETSPLSLAIGLGYRLMLAVRHMPFKSVFSTRPAMKARTVMEKCALAA